MGTDKIYLKPVGGLCNRMRAMDSAVTLATQHGKQLVVFWGRDIHLNCRFSDLFKTSAAFKVLEEQQYLGKKALFPYLPGSKPISFLKSGLYSLTKAALGIEKEVWFEQFETALSPLMAELEPERVKNMLDFEDKSFPYIAPLLVPLQQKGNHFICTAWKLVPEQQYARHFTPTDFLQEKIEAAAANFSKHTVGVHIRRSDHTFAKAHSNLQQFIGAMEQELRQNSATNFYLATDCPETEQYLQQLYPGKIITYSKTSYNRNTTQGIQDAVVDLYTLSRTSKVLGSYYSSFSQVAAEISGIEEVTV